MHKISLNHGTSYESDRTASKRQIKSHVYFMKMENGKWKNKKKIKIGKFKNNVIVELYYSYFTHGL